MNVFRMPSNMPKNRFKNIAVCKKPSTLLRALSCMHVVYIYHVYDYALTCVQMMTIVLFWRLCPVRRQVKMEMMTTSMPTWETTSMPRILTYVVTYIVYTPTVDICSYASVKEAKHGVYLCPRYTCKPAHDILPINFCCISTAGLMPSGSFDLAHSPNPPYLIKHSSAGICYVHLTSGYKSLITPPYCNGYITQGGVITNTY